MSEHALPGAGDRLRSAARHILWGMLGCVFALALSRVWTIEGRWFYVAIIAIVMISVALFLIGIFSDFLLICLMFAVPLAGYGKWFFPPDLRLSTWSSPEHDATLLGTLSIGVIDFLVAGLLLSWAYRILVLREQRLPKLNLIDAYIILFFSVYVISTFGAIRPILGIYATAYLVKFILLYLYISRNFQRRHLWWLIAAIVFHVGLEGGLSVIQYTTGKLLGLGLDKGSGSNLDSQYMVPGTESWHRAAGTFYDSHTLGLFMAMIGPFMLVLSFARLHRPLLNLLFAGCLMVSLFTVLITFSRSAWVASAASMALALLLIIAVWRERQVLWFVLIAVILLLLSAPWTLDLIIQRFEKAPSGTISVRIEGFEVAAYIWSKFWLFGVGAGNFMEALYHYSYGWNQDIVVHNTILLIGSETGIFGVIGFFGAILTAMIRLWRLGRSPHTLVTRAAFAAFIALCAVVVEGMATPMHREPGAYTMIWFLLALAVALPRLHAEATAQPAPKIERGADPIPEGA